MSGRRNIVIIILTVFCISIFSGCGFFGAKQGAKYLRYSVGAEPESLDPRKSTSIAASTVEAQLFEGLTGLDANNNVVPAVAERWEISDDGLKYTFYLRNNARWSNGDPVTAHDFEYAWKSLLNPELASSYAFQLYYLKNGEAFNSKKAGINDVGVRAASDYVLEVTLENPTPYFLSLAAFHTYYPVHARTVAGNEKWAGDPKTIIGNGPFKIIGWVHNNKIELAKNDQYWDAAGVRLPRIDIVLVDNTGTVLSMFASNQLDMAENIPASELPRLLKEGKVKIYPFLGTYYYSFNVKAPPFDNPKVRKAFCLALDRNMIVETITRGGQKPALAFVPYGLPDEREGEDFRASGGDYIRDNDVAAAQKLLAEAGYPQGAGLPPVTLLYNTSENHKMIAEAVQEMWKKNLGVNVQLSNQEWKVFLDNLDRHNFQVARDNWVGDYADAMTFIDLFESTNGNNNPGYKNPLYDELVRLAKAAPAEGERIKAMHDAERILIEEAVIIPLYFYTNPLLVKPNVKGYNRSILGTVYFKEAYLD